MNAHKTNNMPIKYSPQGDFGQKNREVFTYFPKSY